VSITLKCQFSNVDNLKKCLATKKSPTECNVSGGSQQISTLLGIFTNIFLSNVEILSSE
jgi:hypothetical protein